MTHCPSSNLSCNWAWLQIVQLISMETWNQANLLSRFHDFNAGLLLKEVFLTKHINKERRDFLVFDCFLHSRNLILNDIKGLFGLCFTFRNSMGSAECTDDSQLVLIFSFSQLNGSEHFNLVLSIKTISRFNLDGGRS